MLILLTDGLANPVPAAVAVEKAERAKRDGIVLFTIGLGQPGELDMAELQAMATRPEYFYWAPDGEELLGIYRTIAVELPCPGAHFWGQPQRQAAAVPAVRRRQLVSGGPLAGPGAVGVRCGCRRRDWRTRPKRRPRASAQARAAHRSASRWLRRSSHGKGLDNHRLAEHRGGDALAPPPKNFQWWTWWTVTKGRER